MKSNTNTVQVYINRPNTQQSIINFQLPSITDYQGNFNDSTTDGMEFMLTYHENEQCDSTMVIQETTQYVMKLLTDEENNVTDDLQVTLTITDYNQNATARPDVNLIITDLDATNRPPTTKKKRKRYMHGILQKLQQWNYLCSFTPYFLFPLH